jgi:hypothetical protein
VDSITWSDTLLLEGGVSSVAIGLVSSAQDVGADLCALTCVMCECTHSRSLLRGLSLRDVVDHVEDL